MFVPEKLKSEVKPFPQTGLALPFIALSSHVSAITLFFFYLSVAVTGAYCSARHSVSGNRKYTGKSNSVTISTWPE